jgi:hypothetical protein
MVLGASMIMRNELILALCLVGLATDVVAADHTTTVAGWTLQLFDRNDVCILKYTKDSISDEITLTPAPPCRFIEKTGKGVQIERFETKGKKRTLVLVFGTPYQNDTLKSPGKNCGTTSQAIMLTDSNVHLSKRIAEGGLRCEGEEVDKREFIIFDKEWR